MKITRREFKETVKKLKNQPPEKADIVYNMDIQYRNIKKSILNIINKIYRGEGFLNKWRIGLITTTYKNGKKEMHNYRKIALMNTIYKIYTYGTGN